MRIAPPKNSAFSRTILHNNFRMMLKDY